MAENLVESLAKLYANDPKRSNWLGVPSVTGTNDFGFIKVRHVEKIIPNTVYDFNFRSAYSSNPTISPVLSRAKVTVCGIWIPISLYVPALRDGAIVEALKTDYSFPTINFNYYQENRNWNSGNSAVRDNNYYYIPANSIFTELNMWEPYYTPVSRYVPNPSDNDDDFTHYPKGKCAIPLLGYYDFYRHFIMNNQQSLHPLRVKGFSRRYSSSSGDVFTSEPIDKLITRNSLDRFFNNVRRVGNGGTNLNVSDGNLYPQGDDAFNISSLLGNLYFDAVTIDSSFAPVRQLAYLPNGTDTDYVWFNDDHFGEVRANHLSDFNTAYMSNENVEYERSSARVKTDDNGYIDMEQIYAAERVQNFVRRSIFRENDYASFINAETGITPPTNLTKPLFLGSVSSWISYNDVISQAQTSDDESIESNTSLGSRASLGFGRLVTGSLYGDNKQRSFARFTAKEPGYFMLLEWIVPEVAYWQGYNPLYDKTTLMSLYYPAFDRSGFQDQQLVHLAEQISATPNTGSNYNDKYPFKPMSYDTYNVALMQVPAYWEHMAYRNRLCGQMVDSSNYLPWNFHRDYNLSDYTAGPGIETTGNILPNNWSNGASFEYQVTNISVTPEAFHEIYANTQGVDNIQCYYKFQIKKFQPMSHRFLSF